MTVPSEDVSAKSKPSNAKNWQLYIAGFLGGILLALGDLAANDTSATVLKFQAVLIKYVYPQLFYGGTIGIFLIGSLGAISCWIWPAGSRGEAFVRGFSVFAILTVGTPFKLTEGQRPPNKVQNTSYENFQPSREIPGLVSYAYAQTSDDRGQDKNAMRQLPSGIVMIDHPGVSSCKPHYWGLFGLGSLINNSVEICETGHVLKSGTKVKILNCWNTGFRNYRYVEIEYSWDERKQIGWAMTGKGPRYWDYIVLEPGSEKLLPKSCRDD